MGGCKSKSRHQQGPGDGELDTKASESNKPTKKVFKLVDGNQTNEEKPMENTAQYVNTVPCDTEGDEGTPKTSHDEGGMGTQEMQALKDLSSMEYLDARRSSTYDDVSFTCNMLVELLPTDSKLKYVALGDICEEEQTDFEEKKCICLGNFPPNVGQKFNFGFTCRKGLKPDSPNQDDFIVIKSDKWEIYGVFDGHGPFGHVVSHLAHHILPYSLMTDEALWTDTRNALKASFMLVQKHLEEYCDSVENQLDITMSGTTATIVLKYQHKLYAAHVGDSRAVLGRRDPKSKKFVAMELTSDHKPSRPDEKKRIEANGGTVMQLDGDVPYRVFMKGLLLPGLAMSRALGDTIGSSVGVSSIPEISEYELTAESFLVIGSDGVWEFISNQEVVDYVANVSQSEVQNAVDTIAAEAYNRWIKEEGNVVDDVTCLGIWLT